MVLVTGGSSGIGLATARHFAEEAAAVFITGRRVEELDRAAREIGGTVVGVPGDVAKGADLDRLFDRIGREAGRLDVVVANAGIGSFVPLGEYTEEHLDAILAVNVKGTAFTVQKALPLMPDGATVVLLGSIAGATGTPAFGAYAASKAAIRSFARTWAVDLKAAGHPRQCRQPRRRADPGLRRARPERRGGPGPGFRPSRSGGRGRPTRSRGPSSSSPRTRAAT